MNSGWSNVKLRGQMMMKFYDFATHQKLMKEGIRWTRIKWFKLKIREISLFQNQQKFESNLDKNEKQNNF